MRQGLRPGFESISAAWSSAGKASWVRYDGITTEETFMPVIKAYDLAYGRLRSPDLDRQEEFLTDFGMVRSARTRNALYMRGTDAPHHIHVTELGEPGYVGIAVHAASMDDLDKVSKVPGASRIEDIDEPGGGKRVRLTDPDGYQVEVLYGMTRLDPIPIERQAVNSGADKLRRKGELFRIERGPSHIKRFGHFVIMSKNFEFSFIPPEYDPRCRPRQARPLVPPRSVAGGP